MTKKLSKVEVYQLLTGNHKKHPGEQLYITKIAEILSVSKQIISKNVKEMEKQGYIKCDTPKANPKFFSATTKIYTDKESINPDGYVSTKLGRRPGPIIQKARYEITIDREYIDFFKDKHHWIWGNCHCWKYSIKIFDNFDDFEFIKIGKKKIVLIVPGICFKKHELSIAHHTLFWIAYEALKWFAKEAKIKFDWPTLYLCQKPHVTRAALAAWVKRVARDWSLSIDGNMVDSSSGKADWETLVFDDSIVDAIDALENWENVAAMQDNIESLKQKVNQIELEILPAFQCSINKILKEILTIKKIITPELKPLDIDTPSYG